MADVQYLIVAGGGAGGKGAFGIAMGGGGGGGVLTGTTSITATGTFPVVVGAGGVPYTGGDFVTPGGDGGNSSFNALVAIGGGGAGALDAPNGRAGGSGGGGSRAGTAGAGTSGQGNAGGVMAPVTDDNSASGGGGGAGAVGGVGRVDGDPGTRGGAGGAGVSSSITGTAVFYGGGGGGARGGAGGAGGGGEGGRGNTEPPTAGAPNTGGGGGGSRDTNAGAGGSGIVVIRYPTGELTATGGTITTDGSDTIHTFTSSGDFVVTAVSGGTPDPVTGSGAAVAPALTLGAPVTAASGAWSPASVTGTGAALAPTLTLAQPTASASGSQAISPATGTGSAISPLLVLAQPSSAASGTHTFGLSGVTITATKVGVDEAPQSVQFEATATGVSDQSDVVFVWNFDDDYQFRYLPGETKANDRQSGTAIGQKAAHVYRTAGTYTVTCTAYALSGGAISSVSNTQEVVIAASDAAITSRVAISRNGDFTGAPAGATQQTWTGAEGGFTFQPNTAYYFQAGQTFERDLNAVSFSGGGVLKLHRYGAGANPILERGFTMWGPNHGHTSICEVEFRGTFDVDNNPNWDDTGVYPTPPPAPQENGIFVINSNGGQSVLVYGVKVSGFQLNYYYSNNNTNTITHTVDCESTNWFNYGVLDGNDGPSAHVGCHYHQKIGTQPLPAELPQANLQWNSPDGPNTARSGPLRGGDSVSSIINKCRFLSYRSGWSITLEPGLAAIQPAVRIGTNTIADEHAVISQSDLIGGLTVLSASVQNTSTAQGTVALCVVEFNYFGQDLDGSTNEFIATTKPGIHIRGNVVEYASGIAPSGAVGSMIRWVRGLGASSFAENAESFVYGNTLVANGNTAGINWQSDTQITASSRPITYQNNVIQMNGTFDSAGSSSLFQTDYDPLQSAFPFAPLSGSPAFQSYSTGRLPALEQDGTPRTSPFSIGASEEATAPSAVTGAGAADAPALTLGSPTSLGAGALAIAAVTALAACSAPPLTLGDPAAEASGAYAVEAVTGAGAAQAPALSLGQPVASAAATYGVEPVTGTADAVGPSLTLSDPVASGSGAYVTAGVSGIASAVAPALTLGQPVADGAGINIAPVAGVGVAVAPTLSLGAPTATASGSYVVAGVIGPAQAIAPLLTLGQPVASGAGNFAVAGVTAFGALSAPSLVIGTPTAAASGAYSDFEIFPPSLSFAVTAEETIFTVAVERAVFTVAAEV